MVMQLLHENVITIESVKYSLQFIDTYHNNHKFCSVKSKFTKAYA